jgi:glucose-6-phosphate 1-epimerase
MIDIQALNDQFAVAGHLTFRDGPNSLPIAEIRNRYATAEVSLYGAHVLRYQPRGQQPVLWMSKCSYLEPGKPIRGGIPICWPWFSTHPTDAAKPLHGFARIQMWKMLSSSMLDDESIEVRFGLNADDATRALWPHKFQVQYTVTVGSSLRTELYVMNTGGEEVRCTGALHSYFAVGDIRDTIILGLDGSTYIDKMDDGKRKKQTGEISFSSETDRIYIGTMGACVIDDRNLRRTIRVEKIGSESTVVWNPWVEKSKRMSDFAAEEYESMVCVETANAADNIIVIPAAGSHKLGTIITLE